MQQQLIDLVSKKAGIDQSQAQKAVEAVMGFLKDHVPGPLAGQLDNAINGGTQGQSGGLGSKIPGL